MKFHPGGVDASDVDGALFRRKRDESIGTFSGNSNQHLNQGCERDGTEPSEVEVVSNNGRVCAGDQEGIHDVVDITEPSQLRSIAEQLNLLSFNREFHKPPEEAVPRMLDDLARTVRIHHAQ